MPVSMWYSNCILFRIILYDQEWFMTRDWCTCNHVHMLNTSSSNWFPGLPAHARRRRSRDQCTSHSRSGTPTLVSDSRARERRPNRIKPEQRAYWRTEKSHASSWPSRAASFASATLAVNVVAIASTHSGTHPSNTDTHEQKPAPTVAQPTQREQRIGSTQRSHSRRVASPTYPARNWSLIAGRSRQLRISGKPSCVTIAPVCLAIHSEYHPNHPPPTLTDTAIRSPSQCKCNTTESHETPTDRLNPQSRHTHTHTQ